MSWKVPLFDLEYGPEEEAAVLDVMRSRWLTMGDKTVQFEGLFAQYLGVGNAVAVANGTAALHLAMIALDVGPGDEVIVPDLTFVATANAVLYVGATPVLADIVSANDWTMDPADVERKITPQTKAIIVMHYGGYPCDMDEYRRIADAHGIALVEDAAHAPGADIDGRRVGALGDIACFSFFSNKNLATGEGGMVTTNNGEIAERIRLLRSHAMTARTAERHKGHAWGYDVVAVGHNYRLTEIEAVLGIVQLKHLDERNRRRGQLVNLYREILNRVAGVSAPFEGFESDAWPFRGTSAYHIMPILLPEGTNRPDVAARTTAQGIQTSLHYRPLHTFKWASQCGAVAQELTTIDSIADRIMTLPLWPGMTDAMVEEVVCSLESALESA